SVEQHQRRASIEPAQVDAIAAPGVGTGLASKRGVLARSTTEYLWQGAQEILNGGGAGTVDVESRQLQALRTQHRRRAAVRLARHQHLLQRFVAGAVLRPRFDVPPQTPQAREAFGTQTHGEGPVVNVIEYETGSSQHARQRIGRLQICVHRVRLYALEHL